MAVISIMEGYTGVEAGGSIGPNGMKRTATRVFTVVTDTPVISAVWSFPITCSGCPTIPANGVGHPDYGLMYSGVAQVTKKGPCLFSVKVPYETPDPRSQQKAYDDPLSVPAEISWSSKKRVVAYDVDLDGNACVNANDEPVDPPMTREVCDAVLQIERNQASFASGDILAYTDTLSSGTFWGAGAGIAKMENISAHSVYGGWTYWKCRYEICFRFIVPSGTPAGKNWFRCILNQGSGYLDSMTGKWVPSPNGRPVMLAADGTLLDYSSAKPVYLYFRENASANWSGLGLG